MRLRRFFNPEPRFSLGLGSVSLIYLLGGFRIKTLFFSESLSIKHKKLLGTKPRLYKSF